MRDPVAGCRGARHQKMTELSPPEGGELRSFAAPLAGVAGSELEQAAVIRVPADKETGKRAVLLQQFYQHYRSKSGSGELVRSTVP